MGDAVAAISNTEHPIKSVTKKLPEGTPARAECAPRPQTSALAKHSFGEGLLFQNFQREALVQLHSRCTQQRTHGLGRASLPPDHFAQILGMHAQFNHGCLRPVDGLDFYVVRVIHECPGNLLHQFLHSGTSHSPLAGAKRITALDAEPPVAGGGSLKNPRNTMRKEL